MTRKLTFALAGAGALPPLGVAQLNNPSGTGGPSVPLDLAAGTRVTCR